MKLCKADIIHATSTMLIISRWQQSWRLYELALSLFSSSIATNKTTSDLYVPVNTVNYWYSQEYHDWNNNTKITAFKLL